MTDGAPRPSRWASSDLPAKRRKRWAPRAPPIDLQQVASAPGAILPPPSAPLTPEAAQEALRSMQDAVRAKAAAPVPPPVAADRKSKERRRLFVGNVPPSVLDAELLSLFAPFGAERVDTPRDAAGAPRGFGFVEFGSEAQALTALGAMQNFALVDRVLRLSRPSVLDGGLTAAAAPALPDAAAAAAAAVAALQSSSALPAAPAGGRTVVLRNLIGPDDEIDAQLEAEVRDECATFGVVSSVRLGRGGADEGPEATVTFADAAGANTAIERLHGRWFGGRRVHAELAPT